MLKEQQQKQIQNTAYQLPASFGCSPRFHYVSPAPAQIPSLVSLRSFFKAQIGLCLSVGMWPDRETEAGTSAREELPPKQEEAKADLAATHDWVNT